MGYPCYDIKELTIRERVEHLFDKKEIHFLLNEWTISKLLPHTINLVSYDVCNIKEAIGEWTHGASALTNYTGHLVVYGSYAASLIPIPPLLQHYFISIQS